MWSLRSLKINLPELVKINILVGQWVRSLQPTWIINHHDHHYYYYYYYYYYHHHHHYHYYFFSSQNCSDFQVLSNHTNRSQRVILGITSIFLFHLQNNPFKMNLDVPRKKVSVACLYSTVDSFYYAVVQPPRCCSESLSNNWYHFHFL